jgi:hypothetical protein
MVSRLLTSHEIENNLNLISALPFIPEWGGFNKKNKFLFHKKGGLKGALRSGLSLTTALPINKSYYCNSYIP